MSDRSPCEGDDGDVGEGVMKACTHKVGYSRLQGGMSHLECLQLLHQLPHLGPGTGQVFFEVGYPQCGSDLGLLKALDHSVGGVQS